MINFLPLIYQDELLFSIVCRYKQMCGMLSKRALEWDLFKIYNRMGRKSVLFPQNLSAFIANLPPASKLSVQEVILNHTMYPFYTAFLSREKSDLVFNGMVKENGKSIETMVGMAGSKVKSDNYLKYCPLCFKEDMEKLGESYWRRLPQIPGALYCPKHQVLFKNSNVVITDSRNDFLCADEETCNADLTEDFYSNQVRELNLKYMENASYLLFRNQARKELSFIIKFYIDKLRKKGFASKGGTLYIAKLLEAFSYFYPSGYLELMQSSIDVKQEANWLRLFVRNNNKNRSPLRHILFLQFLEIGVEELFESNTAIGKRAVVGNRMPSYSIGEKRREWLKLIEANPEANRSELKRLGKGLHTWIYAHDKDWYDEVTPKTKIRKEKTETVDWEKRDETCLVLAKKAVEKLLHTEGKPIRIVPSNIRRTIGVKRWFLNDNLVKTQQYLKEVTEDIESYRVRKIKWAIDEMNKNGERLTVYKIQLKAGFGGGNKKIKSLIQYISEK